MYKTHRILIRFLLGKNRITSSKSKKSIQQFPKLSLPIIHSINSLSQTSLSHIQSTL